MKFEQPRRLHSSKSRLQIELAEAHARFWQSPDKDLDLFRTYARVLRGWWKEVAFAVILAAAAAGIVSKYFLTRWYTATAIIRPVPQNAVQGQLLGLLSGFGGTGGGAVAGLLGGSSAADADEYVAILTSFAFTRNLIRSHHLYSTLLPDFDPSPANFGASRHLQWLAYKRLAGRFSCQYSVKTGNITLRYEDLSPGDAERVEGYYVDDLREQLRHRQISDTIAAVESLREEAARSADPMIESALYQMIATQIQREKLAEVQADFAFMVLEPPAAPDGHSWPPTLLLCLFAGATAFLLVSGYILFLRRPRDLELPQPAERGTAVSQPSPDRVEQASR
jgi:Chain length determinant protein